MVLLENAPEDSLKTVGIRGEGLSTGRDSWRSRAFKR